MRVEEITPDLVRKSDEFRQKHAGLFKEVINVFRNHGMDGDSPSQVMAFMTGAMCALEKQNPIELGDEVIKGWANASAHNMMTEMKKGSAELADFFKETVKGVSC